MTELGSLAGGRTVTLALLALWFVRVSYASTYLSCPKSLPKGSSVSCYATSPASKLKLLKGSVLKAEATGPTAPFAGAPGLFTFAVAADMVTADDYRIVAYDSSNNLLNVSVPVSVEAEAGLLLLGTDKGIYKPGQAIKVRALYLTGSTRMPAAANITIAMKNPDNFKIFEETASADAYGVANVTVPLARQMKLGNYVLEAFVHRPAVRRRLLERELAGTSLAEATAKIEVDEYVLPKFEVVVDIPTKDIVIDTQSTSRIAVSGTVYGKYTYGERVPGKVTLRLLKGDDPAFFANPGMMGGVAVADAVAPPAQPGAPGPKPDQPGLPMPPAKPTALVELQLDLQQEANNEKAFTLELTGQQVQKVMWLSKLVVEAEMEDAATGTTQSVKEMVNLHQEPDVAKVTMDNVFRPGLPQRVKVEVTPRGDALPSIPYKVKFMWERGHQGTGQPVTEEVALGTPAGQTFMRTAPSENSTCCDLTVVSTDWQTLRNARTCCVGALTVSVLAGTRYVPMANGVINRAGRAFSVSGQYLEVRVDESPNLTPRLQNGNFIVDLLASSTMDLAASGATAQVAISGGGAPLWTGGASMQATNPQPAGFYEARVQLMLSKTLIMGLKEIQVVMMATVNSDSAADKTVVAVPPNASNAFETRLSWNASVVKPNDPVGLNITSASNARVFLLGVDSAVDILSAGTPAPAINDNGLHKALDARQKTGAPPNFAPRVCPSDAPFARFLFETENTVSSMMDDNQQKDNPCPKPPQDVGVWGAGGAGGGDVVMMAAMAPMADGAPMARNGVAEMATGDDSAKAGQGSASPGDGSSTAEIKRVRTYFPETWIFEEVSMPPLGELVQNYTAPDSITEWRVAAFATHGTLGFSDALPMTPLTVRKELFASMSLPPFVVRLEEPSITLTVQNLLQQDVDVLLNITLHADLEPLAWPQGITVSTASTSQGTGQATVKAGSFWRGDLLLRPKAVAQQVGLPIFFSAQTINLNPGRADAVRRYLRVKPSGRPVENSTTVLLRDPTTPQKFMLPAGFANATEGSKFARLKIVGDILGNAMANLESLVRVPTGCGEQTMISLAPNVYVYSYLEASGRLGAALKARLVSNINLGFQRELMYRHSNGGYSAFGESSGEASTWLTAYVLKVFSEASRYVNWDMSVLADAGNFLLSTQKDDGSFEKKGRVIHQDMMGGATDAVGLTAFVSAALSAADFATGQTTFKAATTKAANYLKGQSTSSMSVYTQLLKLKAVAAADGNWQTAAQEALQLRSGNPPHWVSAPTPQSSSGSDRSFFHYGPATLDVEATAYGIMLLISGGLAGDAVQSAQWLVSQQSATGGFVSTQDTVVGLESLAQVANTLSANADVQCSATYAGNSLGNFKVNSSNFDLLQMADISNPVEDGEVVVNCNGTGSAVVSVQSKWNVERDPSVEVYVVDFQWLPIVMPGLRRLSGTPQEQQGANQQVVTVSACASVLPGKESETAQADYHIFTVGLYSGYYCDPKTVEAPGNDGVINRVEPGDGDFHVYLDYFPSDGVCVTCRVERQHQVGELQAVASFIYSYYDHNRRGQSQWALKNASDPNRQPIVTSTTTTTTSNPVVSVASTNSAPGFGPLSVFLAGALLGANIHNL